MTNLTSEQQRQHQWVGPDKLIHWEHCAVCLIIRRADDRNNPCKGPAKITLRKAYSDPKGSPEFDGP